MIGYSELLEFLIKNPSKKEIEERIEQEKRNINLCIYNHLNGLWEEGFITEDMSLSEVLRIIESLASGEY